MESGVIGWNRDGKRQGALNNNNNNEISGTEEEGLKEEGTKEKEEGE